MENQREDIRRFEEQTGAAFGIPDEFLDETPDESVIVDYWEDWEGGKTDGTK